MTGSELPTHQTLATKISDVLRLNTLRNVAEDGAFQTMHLGSRALNLALIPLGVALAPLGEFGNSAVDVLKPVATGFTDTLIAPLRMGHAQFERTLPRTALLTHEVINLGTHVVGDTAREIGAALDKGPLGILQLPYKPPRYVDLASNILTIAMSTTPMLPSEPIRRSSNPVAAHVRMADPPPTPPKGIYIATDFGVLRQAMQEAANMASADKKPVRKAPVEPGRSH